MSDQNEPWSVSRREFLGGVIAAGTLLAGVQAVQSQPGAESIDTTASKIQTRIKFHGHAAFSIITPTGKVLLIDPWLINPSNPKGADEVAALDKVDLILLTHAHRDHIGQAVEIGRKTKAPLCAISDTAKAVVAYLGYPQQLVPVQNVGAQGGTITLLDGELKVTFTQAVHPSSIDLPEEGGKPSQNLATGLAAGLVLTIKDGPTIYHTGDTDLFSDMEHIGWFNPVDYMLVCIGDKFTMGPDRAAYACKLVNPRYIIPMHYGTFPLLTGTVPEFEKRLVKEKVSLDKLRVLTPGEALYAGGPGQG